MTPARAVCFTQMLVLFTAAGCAGLPPPPPRVVLENEAPLSTDTAGGDWPAKNWWRSYGDETLDRLIDLALESAPSLATAHARFDTARQSVRIASAATGAHLEALADADRQRLSDHGVFPPQLLGFYWYNSYDLGLQASYTFDWWGKQKDTVEAAMDEAHAARAEHSAAELALASSIADAYMGWQADQSRLALLHERESDVQRRADIIAARIVRELEPADAQYEIDVDLASLREQIANLSGSAALRIVTIAALVGRPSTQLPSFDARPLPHVDGHLPDDVRIDLMARRADIVASRWRVEAADKSRASARAEFYPDVSINGLLGVQSLDLHELLRYGSRVPQITGAIHLPIFDEGRLKARYGASQAAFDSAVAAYRETLVSAARDVAAEATTLMQLAAERQERIAAVQAAQRSKASADARVRQGLVDERVALAAAETWLEQRDALLQLDAAALSSDIGLKRALGGGYERDPKMARSSGTQDVSR